MMSEHAKEPSPRARPGAARARLGGALRAIRGQLQLTLADVSSRTGIATSTLSKVENEQLSLTYDKLVQLSEGLEIDINAFFEKEPQSPRGPAGLITARRSITRPGDEMLIETPNYDYRYLCTDLSHKAMVPILITIRARSIVQFSQLSRHSGEEFIYVLRGPMQVHTEHYAPATLKTGDAMYIDSTMAHASIATGTRSAVMLNVCHSPNTGHFQTLVELAKAQGKPKEVEPAAL
jgi:transcriptional regulator with XRE-family HTH domain